MKYQDLVKDLQRQMNEQGAKLTVDGDLGKYTKNALLDYEVMLTVKKITKAKPVVIPMKPVKNDFGAPHIFVNLDMLGLDETDPRLVARYEPEWALEGLAGYKGLSGRSKAWCSVATNADLRKAGLKGTDRASASSHSKWGKKSPFWFGCSLDILHKGGGRHICRFLYWIDEAKKIAATLDGNRGNKYCIAITDLSGKGDTLVTGPRWSNELPDGQFVSMSDVLKAHPYLKVGSTVGTSTT